MTRLWINIKNGVGRDDKLNRFKLKVLVGVILTICTLGFSSLLVFQIVPSAHATHTRGVMPSVSVGTINSPPVVISPGSASLICGQAENFTSITAINATRLGYQWYENKSIIPGATSSSYMFIMSKVASYILWLNVTDNFGYNYISNNATVTCTSSITTQPSQYVDAYSNSTLNTGWSTVGAYPYLQQDGTIVTDYIAIEGSATHDGATCGWFQFNQTSCAFITSVTLTVAAKTTGGSSDGSAAAVYNTTNSGGTGGACLCTIQPTTTNYANYTYNITSIYDTAAKVVNAKIYFKYNWGGQGTYTLSLSRCFLTVKGASPEFALWRTTSNSSIVGAHTKISTFVTTTTGSTLSDYYYCWSYSGSPENHSGTFIKQNLSSFPAGKTSAYANWTGTLPLPSNLGFPTMYVFANDSTHIWGGETIGTSAINLTGYLYNTQGMAQAMFTDMQKAEVNSTFPFTRGGSSRYTNYSIEETLQSVCLYAQTLNTTYLAEAEKTANWLNTQVQSGGDIRHICMGYNLSTKAWDTTYSVTSLGGELGYLALLYSCNSSSTYRVLLQKLVDVASLCIQSNGIPYNTMNMNNVNATEITGMDTEYYLANGLTYASHVMQNSTVKNMAYKVITGWPCGTPSGGGLIPQFSVYNNGNPYDDYSKADDCLGQYMYSVEEFLYYYPSNITMANRLYSLALAATRYFWNPTGNYWNYRVNATSGAVLWAEPIQGSGMTDEAILIAGLADIAGSNLHGNSTWINDAKTDYTTNIINRGLICNGLIEHTTGEPEANNYWDQYQRRFGMIYYCYSGNYSFYQSANWLFGNMTEKRMRALGWQDDLYTTYPYADYPTYPNTRMTLATAAIFINETEASINTWNSVFYYFGFPQWGNAPLLVNITLDTKPSGCNVSLDGGAWYAAPHTWTVAAGGSYTIAVQDPYVIIANREEYVWTSWNDGGANPHTVSPLSSTTYTATMTLQYYPPGGSCALKGPYYTQCGIEYWIVKFPGKRPMRIVYNHS